jgi:hypothetical protein
MFSCWFDVQQLTIKSALSKHLVTDSGLTSHHVLAIHKTTSGTFTDLKNLVIDWKFLESATAMPWSSGCKTEVAFSRRNFIVTFDK